MASREKFRAPIPKARQIQLSQTPNSANKMFSNIKGNKPRLSNDSKRLSGCHVPEQLLDFPVEKILNELSKGGRSSLYDHFSVMLRKNEYKDSELVCWLQVLQLDVNVLDKRLEPLVYEFLMVDWSYRGVEVVKIYQEFVINLLTAHNYYLNTVLRRILETFKPDVSEGELSTWGLPTSVESAAFHNNHNLLHLIVKLLPMSRITLLSLLSQQFPYFIRPCHQQCSYVLNALEITSYVPNSRKDVLHLIITKLSKMDSNIQRTELETLEVDFQVQDIELDINISQHHHFVRASTLKQCRLTNHALINTLDSLMTIMLSYIRSECNDRSSEKWCPVRALYDDMLLVFEHAILPTHSLCHVQFVMFYLCSFKPVLYEGFLKFLWKKVETPGISTMIRQHSVAFLGSFLTRAKYVAIGIIKDYLLVLSQWAHAYIAAQELSSTWMNVDFYAHTMFYSVCQTLFYVFIFHHHAVTATKKDMLLIQRLNFEKLVTCSLNPLHICTAAVTNMFARLTHKYQIAYCNSVIERNSRNSLPVMAQCRRGSTVMTTSVISLDVMFPFDPYLLRGFLTRIHITT